MITIISHGWSCRRRLGGNCRLVIVLSVLTAVVLCGCTRYPDYIRQPAVVNTKQLPSESPGLYSPDSQPMIAPENYYQSGLNSNDQYNQRNLNAQLDARSQPWQVNAAQRAQQPPQTISSNDYIYYPTHPKANKAGFIRVIRDNYNPQMESQNQQWDPQNQPDRNQTYNTQETTGYNLQYQGYNNQPSLSGANQQFVESSTPSLQQNPQWQSRPTGTALPNIQIATSQKTDRSYNPGQLAAERPPTVSNVTVTGIGEPATSDLAPVALDAQPVPFDDSNINTAAGISQTENLYNKNVEFPSVADIERMKTYKEQISKTGETPIKEKMPTSITFSNDLPAQNPLSQPNIEPVGPTRQAVSQTTADFTGTVDKIGDSIIHLERYVASHPDDAKAQLTLRLLYSVYGNDDKALQYLPSTPTENQSQSLALAQALLLTTQKTELATDHNEAQAANQALKALESLTKKLSDQADPVISCVKICNENVTGFGKYEVLTNEELQTGLPRTIKVYCELENIKAKLNEEGKYYTDLYAEFTLYDSQLRPKAELKSDVPDTPIYNQRRDFCLWGPLTLPNLPPDKYKITVRVEDKLAGRVAETKSYEFEVK